MKITAILLILLMCIRCFASDEAHLSLVGEIKAKCGFSANSTELWFSDSGFANTELVVNCNTPIQVSLHSEYGGLLHQQSTLVKDYKVDISIEGAQLDNSFRANKLIDTHHFFVDEIVFQQEIKLQLELIEPLVYAGEYRDILRINMTPSSVSGGIR
ncbi:hypothetical protein [Pseudoalteromonas sp.]|uniref:hypothetical protein n=1 Tax=Pseudoalteromonas sp. TaxID=53249 RepID=UPI00257BAE19|nr:hypothetical protein [Pseudoalteromonas sp.]